MDHLIKNVHPCLQGQPPPVLAGPHQLLGHGARLRGVEEGIEGREGGGGGGHLGVGGGRAGCHAGAGCVCLEVKNLCELSNSFGESFQTFQLFPDTDIV